MKIYTVDYEGHTFTIEFVNVEPTRVTRPLVHANQPALYIGGGLRALVGGNGISKMMPVERELAARQPSNEELCQIVRRALVHRHHGSGRVTDDA